MSSQKYASPLRLKIFPSRILLTVVGLLHLGAIAVLLSASLPLWVALTGSLLVTLSLLIGWSRAGWITGRMSLETIWPKFSEAVWDEVDQWQLIDNHQQTYTAQLVPSTYVSARLVVINLRVENSAWYCRHRAIVLMPDNIERENFRRLRIRLRWYSTQDQDNWAASK